MVIKFAIQGSKTSGEDRPGGGHQSIAEYAEPEGEDDLQRRHCSWAFK